jgi:hypothetical protein
MIKKFVLSLFVGILLLVLMLWYVGIENFLLSIQRVSPYWLLLAFVASFLPQLVRALRWKTLLFPVKDSVKYSNTLSIMLVGSLANFLIPVRVGEVARAFLMERREQVKFFEVFSSIVVERLLDLLAIVIIGIIGLFLLPPKVKYPPWAINSFGVVGVLILIGLIVIIVGTKKEERLMKVVDSILYKTLMPGRWKRRLRNWIESTIRGAKGISYNLTMGVSLCIQSFIPWLLSISPAYFLFKAFSIELPLPVLLSGTMLFNLSFILPAPPGYIGSYEVFGLLFLQV